jgi:hypothetical protein
MGSGALLSESGEVVVPQAASPKKSSPKLALSIAEGASPARAWAAGTGERHRPLWGSRRIQSRFIISLLDGLMIHKLPYEKITKG